MDIKHANPVQAGKVQKRRPFRAFAKLAAAGLLLASPAVFPGCGGADAGPAAKLTGPSIQKTEEKRTRYQVVGTTEYAEKHRADAGAEKLEVPERAKLPSNPYYAAEVEECPYW